MPHISALDWKTHSHIGLDLDETLALTFGPFLSYAHSQGELLYYKDTEDIIMHDIHLDERYPMEKERVRSLWRGFGKSVLDPSVIAPVEDALYGVLLLGRLDKTYRIITARNGNDPIKKAGTLAWVQKYFPELKDTDIHFVNHYAEDTKPKSQVCKEYEITLLIDDNIENAKDLCEAGISMILLEKPWNRNEDFNHPLLYRARDWKEIINSLEK